MSDKVGNGGINTPTILTWIVVYCLGIHKHCLLEVHRARVQICICTFNLPREALSGHTIHVLDGLGAELNA